MSTLRIVAVIKAKKEFKDDICSILTTLTQESRKEEGNVSYSLCLDVEDDTNFTVLEEWKSQDAIDFHNSTPHFKNFLKSIAGKTDHIHISVLKQLI